MNPGTKRGLWREIGLQLPFLLWLIVLWMLLWGQFTVLSAVTGIAVALFVTRVFRLPTIELSGRINLWWAALLVVQFLTAVVHGSLSVAAQVLNPRRAPRSAIIAVPLRYADDLVMTHVAVTSSLIPGSLVVEADRDTRTLYLHVIGVRSLEDVEHQRAGVLRWERRIVRALGTPAQAARLRADERAEGERLAGAIAGSSPTPRRPKGSGPSRGSGSSQGSEEGRR